MADSYELIACAEIKHGHSVVIVDDGGEDDYRIEFHRPNDKGKALVLRLSVTECEALMQCLMDAVG